MCLSVIAFNAIWISVDADHNDATILVEADPLFILADNFFCTFFTFEWAVRFGAFKRKRNCLRDGWFVFDTIMCTLMVLETWVVTFIILTVAGGSFSMPTGNASILKIARLAKLTRMARMLRLLHALPELMVLIKAMAVA